MKKVKLVGYSNSNDQEKELPSGVIVIDGYSIADRLLEGVLFNVTIENNEVKSVVVDESSKDYFGQFNQEEFYGKIRTMIEGAYEDVEISEETSAKYDVQSEGFTEPLTDTPKPTPQPMRVGKTSFFG